MGVASSLLGKLGLASTTEHKVVFLGLDGTGKTSILYKLSAHNAPAHGPTIGARPCWLAHVGGTSSRPALLARCLQALT